jgi:hypothetical protein
VTGSGPLGELAERYFQVIMDASPFEATVYGVPGWDAEVPDLSESAEAEVDRACRQPIVEAGLGDSFPHPTGHGIGLESDEAPRLRPGARDRIAAGTPVAIEPGVYLPGFGGVRIEDLVVARPGGHELLTTATKELLEL